MRTAVVTTCNYRGWAEYGAKMVSTFQKFWPKDVPLHLYAESFEPLELKPEPPVYLRQLPKWYEDFKQRHANNDWAHGRRGGSYNIFTDAVKFGHKVAAWTDLALTGRLAIDRLIMADADIVTHAPVTHEWLDPLCPDSAYIAWLERSTSYPECGFFILNCNHKYHHEIVNAVRRQYTTDNILQMTQTHDCMAMQRVINDYAYNGRIKTHSLSGDYARTSHPLINGPLGACLDHLKGPRKILGKSRASDLSKPRSETYWKS